MKLFKILAIAAMAMVSSASAQAGVVLSNMGANGLTDTSGIFNGDIQGTSRLASGFTTGSVAQILDWVSIVGFNNDVTQKTVAIFSDNAGNPGAVFATSAPRNVGTKDVLKFDFTGVTLAANTKYWVLPELGLSWYLETEGEHPDEQNGSGFSSAGVRMSSDSGSSWSTAPGSFTLAVSTSNVPAAVPEPALTSLLCLSGIALIRRRMKK
jgi:hypothetical protein